MKSGMCYNDIVALFDKENSQLNIFQIEVKRKFAEMCESLGLGTIR